MALLKITRAEHYAALQRAAQRVIDETDRINNSDPWLANGRAPYSAITELRLVLKALEASQAKEKIK